MQYSFISAAILALVSSVVAQTAGFDAITSPTQDQNIPAGSSFDIIWQAGTQTGPITITLLQGATPSTLQKGAVIASGISNSLGKYTWSVPSTSSFATYGFEITLDSAPTTLQYSFPFHITGGSSSSASGSGSATGSASSTTTIHLSTGPSYTSSTPSSTVVTSVSTSSVPSTTATVVSTSVNSTISSATLVPTSSSASNLTLSTTLTKASSTKTSSSTGTSSASPVSTNAAATQIAGSIAMVGGLVLALAL